MKARTSEGSGPVTEVTSVEPGPGGAPELLGRTQFLNRTRELAAVKTAFQRAAAGHGSLLMIGGEGGIGKTRLVTELTARAIASNGSADERAARVAWGRCWESGGAPNLWPWKCVLRELFAGVKPNALRDQLGSAAPVLAPLVPELAEALPELEAGPVPDSEQSRFVLFDALAGFLRRAAAQQTLVVVLDDLHAADQLSLLALLFVARQLEDMRVLVIGTHRDDDIQHSPRLEGLFTKLLRAAERVPLSGLEPTEIASLIEHRGVSAGDPAVAQSLHRATGGNPFFADEVLRLLVAEGRLDSLLGDPDVPLRVPMGVRALIEQRLEGLPNAAMQALRSSAVIGSRFSLATLAEATGFSRADLLAALEPAIDTSLIEVSAGEVAKFSFSHDLIRETVYVGMAPLERARIHAAVGEALARRYAGSADHHLDELANHFLHALPAGEPAIAVEYAARAADHALESFAYERAGRLYRSALEALELQDELSDEERCASRARLLLGNGRAQLRVADPDARETLLEAAAAARAAGSPTLLAAVALAFGAFALSPRRVDEELTGLLEEALVGIGPEDSVLRVHLLSRLARALYWGEDADRRRRLIDDAIAMARRLDDQEALAIALGNCIPASRTPDTAELELGWIDELLSLPHPPGELVVLARSIEIDLLLERGALVAADAAIDSLQHHAERLRDARARAYVPAHRARRAVMEGRYADVGRLIAEAYAVSRDIEESTIPLIVVGQRFGLEWLMGRMGEVEPDLRRVAEALPYMQIWRAALATLHLARGDRAEAERTFNRLAERGFADIPRNNQWTITMTLISELCAALGDNERAGQLYELLLPYAGLTSVSPVGGYAGPVARYLGLLARTQGETGLAEQHLRAALDQARRHRERAMVAIIAVDLAQTLGTLSAEAEELLEEARLLAAELGSPAVAERADAVAAELGASGERPSPRPSVKPLGSAVLTREGEIWAFQFDGRTVRVRDSKGVHHLAELLSRPAVEIHALDLTRASDTTATAPDDRVGLAVASEAGLSLADAATGAGSALDPAAKAAYRRRIEDLREEVEEAIRWGDPERAARAREEMDFIATELAAAVGIGGRDRPQASDAERARVNVTRAIKSAVRKVGAEDAQLGAELEATVRTGLFCRFEPDPRRPVHWEVHG
jgi:tetratricopeptide (TPR) repeat protein